MLEEQTITKKTQKTNYRSKFNQIDNFFFEEKKQEQFYDLFNNSLFISTTNIRKCT